MTPSTVEIWQPFLSVVAEAAATLSGLVFIAVSLNLQVILEVPGRTSLAVEALLQFLGAMFLSLAALVPSQPPRALGLELLVLDAVLWFVQTRIQVAYIRRETGQPVWWAIKRILRTQAACIPFGIAAVLLARGSISGMYWLAAGCLVSFYAALANAWVILVEILR